MRCDLKGTGEFSLFVPKHCMAPNQTYTFRFSAWPSEQNALAASAEFVIHTTYSGIAAASSAMSGLVDATKSIQLSVQVIDPDESDWTKPTYYSWTTLACPGRGQLGSISSSQLAEAYLKRQSQSAGAFVRFPVLSLHGVFFFFFFFRC